MIEELLMQEESKTLEFKENTTSLQKIIQTIIAFSNSAGGTIVIGVRDKTKEVIGLNDALLVEEQIASAVADSITPLLIPLFQLYTWRNKDLLIITVPHSFVPYFLKSKGLENGTFVRLGSTNRLADKETINQIQQLRSNKNFDEQPHFDCPLSDINLDNAKELFLEVSKKFTQTTAYSLGLLVKQHAKTLPTNGAVLLFGKNLNNYFPDARIRLARFEGIDKTRIIDHQDLSEPLTTAISQIIAFIRRHTATAAVIGEIKRKDIPQYPPIVIREAVINALLHADYSIKGASITVAIFDDRIEITNPGCLPYGLSMTAAISGISQIRNRVIGRTFRELNFIEQWGSGLGRMINTCQQQGIARPKFEEVGNFFRITLYHKASTPKITESWHHPIIQYLEKNAEISPKKALDIWKVTSRTASSRLKKMCDVGILVEISTSPYDPAKTFRKKK